MLGTSITASRDERSELGSNDGSSDLPRFMPQNGVLASNGVLYDHNNNVRDPSMAQWAMYGSTTRRASMEENLPRPILAARSVVGYGGLSVEAQNPNVVMVSALTSGRRWNRRRARVVRRQQVEDSSASAPARSGPRARAREAGTYWAVIECSARMNERVALAELPRADADQREECGPPPGQPTGAALGRDWMQEAEARS